VRCGGHPIFDELLGQVRRDDEHGRLDKVDRFRVVFPDLRRIREPVRPPVVGRDIGDLGGIGGVVAEVVFPQEL